MELSISQMSDAVAQADVQGTFLLMAFAKWKQANPALDNPSIIVGHVLTFDVTQAINLVRLT